jgi:hypothetical protein
MEIAKHADIRSAQNAGEPHGHRHTLHRLAAEIRRNVDGLKKRIEGQTGHFDFQNDFRVGLSFYYCSSAMLLEAFMSRRWGINARLLAICLRRDLRKHTPFFEKIRKNAEPHPNRNGVHGNFKNNPAPSLSPEMPGQSSRKVSSLFRHDRRIMRVFHTGKRRLPAWTRPQLANNAFTERAPKSRIGLSRGDVGQLSVERWGRYKPGEAGLRARDRCVGWARRNR